MRKQKTIAAVAMTAALAAGALIGSTLGNPLASGAQDNSSTTTTAPSASSEETTGSGKPGGRGPGGRFGGGFDLEVAATTLGVTTEELRTQLKAGKSLADVAEAEGVDKQTLIDALVTAGEKRLDEAKAALPELVAKVVDASHDWGKGGFGGHGPGGRFGASLEVAAEALGVSEDDLKTALRDGKTIADVAEERGVDQQKVIDALVADAKTKTAAAVEEGTITQEQADKRLDALTEHITKFVTEGFGKGGFGEGERPKPPADAEGETPAPDGGD